VSPLRLIFLPWLKPPATPLVVGDGCPVHQPFVTNLIAAEFKLAEMQKNLALKSFRQCHSTVNFWQQVPESKYPEDKRSVYNSFLCRRQTNFSLAASFWGICLLSAFILLRRLKLASVSIYHS